MPFVACFVAMVASGFTLSLSGRSFMLSGHLCLS